MYTLHYTPGCIPCKHSRVITSKDQTDVFQPANCCAKYWYFLTLALHSSMYVTLKPQPFARTSAPLVEAMRDPIMAGTLYRSPTCRCSPIGF